MIYESKQKQKLLTADHQNKETSRWNISVTKPYFS